MEHEHAYLVRIQVWDRMSGELVCDEQESGNTFTVSSAVRSAGMKIVHRIASEGSAAHSDPEHLSQDDDPRLPKRVKHLRNSVENDGFGCQNGRFR
jgi:hypothetical protein